MSTMKQFPFIVMGVSGDGNASSSQRNNSNSNDRAVSKPTPVPEYHGGSSSSLATTTQPKISQERLKQQHNNNPAPPIRKTDPAILMYKSTTLIPAELKSPKSVFTSFNSSPSNTATTTTQLLKGDSIYSNPIHPTPKAPRDNFGNTMSPKTIANPYESLPVGDSKKAGAITGNEKIRRAEGMDSPSPGLNSNRQLTAKVSQTPRTSTKKLDEVQEKITGIVRAMQKKEDEISRLRSEMTDLKDILAKHSVESYSSKHLCYSIQKQLNSIEEKIELQRLEHTRSSTSTTNFEPPPSSKISCSDSTPLELDVDKFLEAVAQLNTRVENGQSMGLCYTTGGASFKRWDGISLTLFKNGILLVAEKDFMPFSCSRAKYFVQDVLDGFFPNEFQTNYPNGVYMTVKDERNVSYSGSGGSSFSGSGQVLAEAADLPKLIPGRYLSSCKQCQFLLPSQSSSPPAMSASESLDNINASLISLPSVQYLPSLHASYETLLAKRVLGLDDKMLKIKLKNTKTGHCYKLGVSHFAKVGEIESHLSDHIEVGVAEKLVLILSLPVGILSVPSATLKDYGLSTNTLLYLRVDKVI